MESFLNIVIVGAALSLLIEWIKNKLGTTSVGSKALTLVAALVVGGLFVWLESTPFFETVLTVLGSASIVYGFFLKQSSST